MQVTLDDPNIAALVFFFGIFWAAIFSRISQYRLFYTGESTPAMWFTGIFFHNIYPLLLLVGLALLSEGCGLVPEEPLIGTITCAALASMSAFSMLYFLRAVVVYKRFTWYNARQRMELDLRPNERYEPLFDLGLCYLILGPGLAALISLLFK